MSSSGRTPQRPPEEIVQDLHRERERLARAFDDVQQDIINAIEMLRARAETAVETTRRAVPVLAGAAVAASVAVAAGVALRRGRRRSRQR